MASIRSLKKDINFLASELVTQAYMNQILFKESDEKLTKDVISALDFRSNLLSKVNHVDGKDNPKMVKKYFSKLRKEMVSDFDKLFNDSAKQSLENA